MSIGMNLTAIKARERKATPGPWTHAGRWGGRVRCEGWGVAEEVSEDDGDFIANARTDVPALIAEVERLRLAWLRLALTDFYDAEGVEIWIHSAHNQLNGQRPIDMIPTADFALVEQVIDQLRSGAYA